MTITNNTSVTLTILGSSLKPNKSSEYPEMENSTVRIFSEIGSCIITTQNGKRRFENERKLVAEEGEKIGNDGKREVKISSIS